MADTTVIVPVYRTAPYLRRCIDSILTQSFTDFELVLVDDGSPDACALLSDEALLRDERVLVIHGRNTGVSGARNTGLDYAFAASDSAWLAMIDSDDWIHPRYLEYLHRAATQTGLKLAACVCQEVTEQTPYPELPCDPCVFRWDAFWLQHEGLGVVVWNKLYARELFEGLRYPVGKIHEDEFLSHRILHRAGEMAFLYATMYYYFINPKGITKSGFSMARYDASEALWEAAAFARSIGNEPLRIRFETRFLFHTMGYLQAMREADKVPPAVKREKEREMRRKFRRVLLRDGRRIEPYPNEEQYNEEPYYVFAFPRLHRLVRRLLRTDDASKRRSQKT